MCEWSGEAIEAFRFSEGTGWWLVIPLFLTCCMAGSFFELWKNGGTLTRKQKVDHGIIGFLGVFLSIGIIIALLGFYRVNDWAYGFSTDAIYIFNCKTGEVLDQATYEELTPHFKVSEHRVRSGKYGRRTVREYHIQLKRNDDSVFVHWNGETIQYLVNRFRYVQVYQPEWLAEMGLGLETSKEQRIFSEFVIELNELEISRE